MLLCAVLSTSWWTNSTQHMTNKIGGVGGLLLYRSWVPGLGTSCKNLKHIADTETSPSGFWRVGYNSHTPKIAIEVGSSLTTGQMDVETSVVQFGLFSILLQPCKLNTMGERKGAQTCEFSFLDGPKNLQHWSSLDTNIPVRHHCPHTCPYTYLSTDLHMLCIIFGGKLHSHHCRVLPVSASNNKIFFMFCHMALFRSIQIPDGKYSLVWKKISQEAHHGVHCTSAHSVYHCPRLDMYPMMCSAFIGSVNYNKPFV